VGSTASGTESLATGVFYRAQVRDGIDGTIVADPTFAGAPTEWTRDGATAWDGYRVWTVNGTRWAWR
jgi:hypothetical protein